MLSGEGVAAAAEQVETAVAALETAERALQQARSILASHTSLQGQQAEIKGLLNRLGEQKLLAQGFASRLRGGYRGEFIARLRGR